MDFIIIGNIISFAAAVFTALSSWSHSVKKVYLYQAVQCTLLAIASIFFNSWSGIATLILCTVRNLLSAYGLLTKKILAVMLVILVFIGIFTNNRGAVGWIVVSATMLYTLGACFLHTEYLIKINIFINMVLWIIYDLLIRDYSSFAMESVILVITFIAIIRARKFVPESN